MVIIVPICLFFNILTRVILASLDDFTDKDLLSELKVTKKVAKQFLQRVYVKQKGSDLYNLLAMTHQEYINAKVLIDFLLSSFKVKEIIDPKLLISQFISALNSVSSAIGFSTNFSKVINRSQEEILLCISCILHYCEFRMISGDITHIKLKFSSRFNKEHSYFSLSPHMVMPTIQNKPPIKVRHDIMFLRFDITKYLLEEQLNIIENNMEVETFDMFRDKDNKLKIKIVDHSFPEN